MRTSGHGTGASAAPASPLALTGPELQVLAARENFPVAPWFLPARERAALLSLYSFARLVDDLSDEPGAGPPERRLRLLDAVEQDLDRLYAGDAARLPAVSGLARAVADHALPDAPFRALIEANRQDQRCSSYEGWDELLAYCALSAAPVGELVLRVFGAATSERLAWSRDVCAGLQVVEHLQDVGEDWARGRTYVPRTELAAVGLPVHELLRPGSGPALARVVDSVAARASALLDAGPPLVASLHGRPRIAVAAFVGGGRAALDSVRRAGARLPSGAPRVARSDLVRHTLRLLAPRRDRG